MTKSRTDTAQIMNTQREEEEEVKTLRWHTKRSCLNRVNEMELITLRE